MATCFGRKGPTKVDFDEEAQASSDCTLPWPILPRTNNFGLLDRKSACQSSTDSSRLLNHTPEQYAQVIFKRLNLEKTGDGLGSRYRPADPIWCVPDFIFKL
jgi:hypothetical protein